jgi:hypothetical protein
MNKRFFHIRNVDGFAAHNRAIGDGGWMHPHGGVTFLVQQTGPDTVAVSYSECSLKDNFCRKTGRSFAQDHRHTLTAVSELPSYMQKVVEKSKRLPSPSVTDFSFTTKYFTEKVAA